MKNKKSIYVIFLFFVLLVLGILGFSYAYLKIAVEGESKTNVVVAGNLQLDFNDETSLSYSEIYPGDSFTKIFTVTNISLEALVYAIDWEEYNNTFINGEIHIRMSCLSYINYGTENQEINGECEGMEEREATSDVLIEGVEIDPEITHEYDVTITFIETDANQDYNKNKMFNATLKIVDRVALALNLGGGETEQIFKTSYEPGEEIILEVPEKEDYEFIGWSVTGTLSSVEGNVLTIGVRNTTLITNWKIYPLLTVNLNGGTTTQTFKTRNAPNSVITLTVPEREDYEFTGWTVSGTGASLNGNSLTTGTEDTTLTANWKIYPLLTVNLNEGTTTQTFKTRNAPNSVITLTTPMKNGYIHSQWTVSGTGASLNENLLTMGTEDTTLTASWLAFADMYTYTGSSTVINDGNGNWRIKFLTSGTFSPKVKMTIEAFLVGGGGGGGNSSGYVGGGGGGGGYTTYSNSVSLNVTTYSISIGAGGSAGTTGSGTAGSATTAFILSASGGAVIGDQNGAAGGSGGGAGGSKSNNKLNGGDGGSYGSAGSNNQNDSKIGGAGGGVSTCEFRQGTLTGCDSGVTAYSGGGGGGFGYYSSGDDYGTEGAAGAGCGASANTGCGGRGRTSSGSTARAGISGIVVIRNKR